MTDITPDAGTVISLLARAGVQLAILETTSGGPLAARLKTVEATPAVITCSHVIDDVEALSTRFHVSAAKIEAFGLLSEMVAAEVATALIDTYEGGWGLALMGNRGEGQGVNEEASETVVALGTPSATLVRRHPTSAAPGAALALLAEQAAARLQSR